jgi:uncharacterized protein involved in type VI secretion and phage assembly
MEYRGSNGIVIGLVSSLNDDANLGRVKVRFPHLDNQESDWARIAAPMAGPNRGVFFRPEVDDEVLVAFEHGDPRRPYILGALWSQTDQPPADDGNRTQNNWRFIQSRSGHIILLDDTAGSEKIVLVDKDGQRRVVIDSANQKIQVQCDMGDVDIEAPTGKVTIKANEIELNATTSVKIQAVAQVDIQATAGATSIKGTMVNIN